MSVRRSAIAFAFALLAGCGFFQNLDGYSDGYPLTGSAPPAPSAPPIADGSVSATLEHDRQVDGVDASVPLMHLAVVGGDDEHGIVVSMEVAALQAGALSTWMPTPLAFTPGTAAAYATVDQEMVATGILDDAGAASGVYLGAFAGGGAAWTAGPSLAAAVTNHAAAAGTFGVVVTGGTAANGDDTNASQLAPFVSPGALGPWKIDSVTLPSPLSHHASAAVGTWALVIGGVDGKDDGGATGAAFESSVESAGELAAWAPFPPLGTPRADLCVATSTLYGTRLFAIGGIDGGNPLADVESIGVDPTTGKAEAAWRAATPLPTARTRSACSVAGDRLYVFGGIDADDVLDRVDSVQILPSGDLGAWVAETHLAHARAGAGALTVVR